MTTRTNILPWALVATATFGLCACGSTELFGPAGRRARMPDEQLQAVLKQDFPVGSTKAEVRAKAEALGMTASPAPVAAAGGDEDEEGAGGDVGGDDEVYTFSFDPDSGWGVTRAVRVQYGADGRVKRTLLERRFGGQLEQEPPRSWIHVEGAP